MKHLICALVLAMLSVSTPQAQENPVVVELFTSQGCATCPPADDMMGQLAARDDVIALALHVDYWDYIGWKDQFADPRNAERQRGYATVAGRRSVYTPEMIVNGQTDIVGSKPMKLMTAISEHSAKPATIDLDIARKNGRLHIDARRLEEKSGPLSVQMLRYVPIREARITRGENAGRTIAYTNVTEQWNDLGTWESAAPLDMDVALEGDAPVVVLIQMPDHGPILAADVLK